jgi:hypothetical protein
VQFAEELRPTLWTILAAVRGVCLNPVSRFGLAGSGIPQVEQRTDMSWYSLLGVGIAAWITAAVAFAFAFGLLVSRRRRLEQRQLAPVFTLGLVARAGIEQSRAVG